MKCPKCKSKLFEVLNNKETRAWSCSICGKWLETPKVVMAMPTAPSKPNNFPAQAMKPCPVIGCEHTMRQDSERSMCNKCVKSMYDWLKGAQTTKPPVVEVDGVLWLRKEYEKGREAA